MSPPKDKLRTEFEHYFEGKSVLDHLLALSELSLETEAVIEYMQDGHDQGLTAGELFPEILGERPRFPDPEVAQAVYQNLLGLWDEVQAGKAITLERGPKPPPREKRQKPVPPPPFAPGEPDESYVEAAWRFLEDDVKERTRLMHVFENRQHAVLTALDESELSDEGYAVARHLLFELFAMLELGWPAGLGSVRLVGEKRGQDAPPVPAALASYTAEALHEAELDEESPVTGDELARVRSLVERGSAALWSARKGV